MTAAALLVLGLGVVVAAWLYYSFFREQRERFDRIRRQDAERLQVRLDGAAARRRLRDLDRATTRAMTEHAMQSRRQR